MPSILTITFSPCVDKSSSVPELITEKKMKCSAPVFEQGGGGINVARAIKKMGGEATAVYPAGGNMGSLFNKLMAHEGIPSLTIQTKDETRENIILLEERTNLQYRFGMPGTLLRENEWQQILDSVIETRDVEFIVASGSLPPGVPSDVYARLAIIAKQKKARLVVDTSGEPLKKAAQEGVYLIKPNLGELSSLTNIPYLEPQQVVPAAQQIIGDGNCEVIVVSMGELGAVLVTKDKTYQFTPPNVKRKSTVGAGDSMLAGIVLSLAKGKDLENALQYGVACGTAATMNPGTELCRLQDAETLYESMCRKKDG
jgi:6-phosphofructokinase 2